MAQARYASSLKFSIVGDSLAGKASLLRRFIEDQYSTGWSSRITEGNRVVSIDNTKFNFRAWIDTRQEERYRITHPNHIYRGADGILLVYSVTTRSSFENIRKWMFEIESYASEGVPVILVGAQSDSTPKERNVSFAEGRELAKQLKIPFIETSAKDGINVDQTFFMLGRLALANWQDQAEKQREADLAASQRQRSPKSIPPQPTTMERMSTSLEDIAQGLISLITWPFKMIARGIIYSARMIASGVEYSASRLSAYREYRQEENQRQQQLLAAQTQKRREQEAAESRQRAEALLLAQATEDARRESARRASVSSASRRGERPPAGVAVTLAPGDLRHTLIPPGSSTRSSSGGPRSPDKGAHTSPRSGF